VPVDAPGEQEALGEAVLPRPPDVVHHLVAAVVDDSRADPVGDVVQRLVPRHPLPLARTTVTGLTQRVQDPLRVVDLVDGGRTLGAVAAT
jgi:hypothetical protein